MKAEQHPVTLYALFLLLAILLFIITFNASVSNSNSDPRLSLLVSLAIIEQGSVRLDAYEVETTPPLTDPDNIGRLIRQNGHLYYSFPLGTSVAAVPAVWLAGQMGRDLTLVTEQNKLQNGLASLSIIVIFFLIFYLSHIYLNRLRSLYLTTILTFGSMIISVLGTALWSHHLALAGMLFCLIIVAKVEQGVWNARPWVTGVLIGGVLFFTYFARPSTGVFVLCYLALIFTLNRKLFLYAALVSGFGFGLFLLWSYGEFGTLFPFYYRPGRLSVNQAGFFTAIYGQLFSPSRGLFVFVPYLLLFVPFAIWQRRKIAHPQLLTFIAVWASLQLIVTYIAAPWWSGRSFGPRIQLDFWPALILLIIISWRHFITGHGANIRTYSVAILAVIAIWIHSYQGLFNQQVTRWNGIIPPEIDSHPEIALDWRYPQIGTTNEAICRRNRAFLSPRIADLEANPIQLSQPADSAAGQLLYQGWSTLPEEWLWSECHENNIFFYWRHDETTRYELQLQLHSLGVVEAELLLNGMHMGKISMADSLEPQPFIIPIPHDMLQRGTNELTFVVDRAGTVSPQWPYRIGLGLSAWEIRPFTE